jgi:hypothetical protein
MVRVGFAGIFISLLWVVYHDIKPRSMTSDGMKIMPLAVESYIEA